jgi:hypothetical protein
MYVRLVRDEDVFIGDGGFSGGDMCRMVGEASCFGTLFGIADGMLKDSTSVEKRETIMKEKKAN